MSSELFACDPEDPVEDALRAMAEHQVRRLPVLDPEGRMVGLVILADLEAACAGQPADAAAQRD
jgi:CBS domain-containing protein